MTIVTVNKWGEIQPTITTRTLRGRIMARQLWANASTSGAGVYFVAVAR